MSEISITRFQPALVAREKVNSVQAADSDASLGNTQNPLEGKGQQQDPSHPSDSYSYSQTADADTERPAVDSDEFSTEQAVSRLNDYVQSVKRDLIFDFDPSSGEPSVSVVDRESRKVLRQFDSEEALELARKLEKQETISLFKTQV